MKIIEKFKKILKKKPTAIEMVKGYVDIVNEVVPEEYLQKIYAEYRRRFPD